MRLRMLMARRHRRRRCRRLRRLPTHFDVVETSSVWE
jgi:hypothetical protein